ncbi:MAG TPA: Hsp70 family protein, partial [candidate division Zixibacteria bacterium]|nr:Hsp70 family protein [candidate division Zixibacteria bacterium]
GWVIGRLAIRLGSQNPENAVFNIKRHMDDANHKVSLGNQEYNPIDISSKTLSALTDDVYAKYPSGTFEIEGVVVTVPYYFTTMQRRNTQEAAEQTGLHVLGIIEEPTAAALAFSLEHKFTPEPQKVLVFDLGGGTFDITIFQVTELSDKILFEVLSSGGDCRLGGVDFDDCITQHCVEFFQNEYGIDPLNVDSEKDRAKARSLVREMANTAKEDLSAMDDTLIQIPNWLPGKHLEQEITRTEFESLINPWVEKITKITENTIETAGLRGRDLNIVLAAGGSSKIPQMRNLIQEITGKEPFQTDPDLHIAQGAAIYAAILDGRIEDGKEVEVINRTSHSLGVGTDSGRFEVLIPANRPAPTKAKKVFYTTKTEEDIDVYEGSAATIDKNTKIGTVKVRGIKPPDDLYITFEVSRNREISVLIKGTDIFETKTLTG